MVRPIFLAKFNCRLSVSGSKITMDGPIFLAKFNCRLSVHVSGSKTSMDGPIFLAKFNPIIFQLID
jgi:hypothetical protein